MTDLLLLPLLLTAAVLATWLATVATRRDRLIVVGRRRFYRTLMWRANNGS